MVYKSHTKVIHLFCQLYSINSFLSLCFYNQQERVLVKCFTELLSVIFFVFFLNITNPGQLLLTHTVLQKLSQKYKEEAPSSSKWAEIRQVIFSWHYGSVIFMIFIVGIAHGCIWGFLFWHLENLGKYYKCINPFNKLYSLFCHIVYS